MDMEEPIWSPTIFTKNRDRLQRTVAIKLISAGGGGSTPEDRGRLLDEARAASGLTHPHICTIYEVGEIGSRAFIAMEYVEGQPLSESVPHDGLRIETVVRYGVQVADALAHAHERGTIHRDLKTANIVISTDGGAKVLDFGIARRVEPHGTDMATRSVDIAEAGTLVGTLAYIAPEALLGQQADPRSDIWSFGVVLYEMATGGLPFKGRNEFELTATILRAPARPFPAGVPPLLRAIILHCLAKEPSQRYQRAGEARAALEAIQSDISALPTVVPVPRARALLPVIAAILVAALAAGWMLLRDRGEPPARIAADGQLTRLVSSDNRTSDPALSPDGRMLAYVLETRDGRVDLYVGRVSGGARIQLTNDEAREASPRFSPDGERLAFTRRTGPDSVPEIRIIPALGGDAIATIPQASFPAWSPDGRRLAYLRREGAGNVALTVAALDGSEGSALLLSDSVYPFLRNPAWSPDGRNIAIVRGTGGIAGEIWLVPAEGGPPRRVLDEPASVFSDWPVFTRDQRGLVHASNRGGATNIWFVPLDGGGPLRLTTGSGSDESPSIAEDGTIAFVNSRWRNTLEVHDLSSGSTRMLLTHTPFLWAPAISPSGRQIGSAAAKWMGAGTSGRSASTAVRRVS
jgi:eukaryotic-like serine/threonine-protein kinase